MIDDVERYLNGDDSVKQTVVETLRRLGEESALCLGVEKTVAFVIGIDFAAYMLTHDFAALYSPRDHLYRRLLNAAKKFALVSMKNR